MSTLVVAEHEGGFVKPSSLSALAAAEAIGKDDNRVSLLLGGSGPGLHKAAEHAASSHPLVSEVWSCATSCSYVLLCLSDLILEAYY